MLQNRLVLLLIGIGSVGVVLFNLGVFSRSPGGGGRAVPAPPPLTLASPTPPKGEFFVLHGVSVAVGEDAASWRRERPAAPVLRDPFLPLLVARSFGGETPAPLKIQERTGTPAPAPLPALQVTAVIIGGSRRVAIINQEAFTVGDQIGTERILDIQSDRVVLGKGAQRRELLIE